MIKKVKLEPEHLNYQFLENFIDCCLIKPKVTQTSNNTRIGYHLWKSRFRSSARNYIRQYFESFNSLPSNIHCIKSAPLDSKSRDSICNVVKFPNIAPHHEVIKGRAKLLNKFPRDSDSGCFSNSRHGWHGAPTKYRSLRFLRTGLFWPHRAPLEFLYRLQQHTKISDETLLYLCKLVTAFLKVHEFPPNLVLLRDLINKLPPTRRSTKEARELLKAINQLEDESRAKSVFLNVDYVVKQGYSVRLGVSGRLGGWDNIWLIPEKEKFETFYRKASNEITHDVYVLSYKHQQHQF